jgi:hypothetical protein
VKTKNVRSRMAARSVGKHEYGDKGRSVKYWAHLGCCILPLLWPVLAWGAFWNFKPFMSLIFKFFFRATVNCGYWISRYRVTTVYTVHDKSSRTVDLKYCGTNILTGKWFKKNSSWTTYLWIVVVLRRTDSCTPNHTSSCHVLNPKVETHSS